MIISLIAVVDQQFGLGNANKLLCHLPADLQHFKRLTMGNPVIMGRKTFESIGKALPGRKNIVLSHQISNLEGVVVADSLAAALKLTSQSSEVFIIGGASLYRQAIEKADRIYLTKIHYQFNADVFFPPLLQDDWECTQQEFRPHDEHNCYDLTFCVYHAKCRGLSTT